MDARRTTISSMVCSVDVSVCMPSDYLMVLLNMLLAPPATSEGLAELLPKMRLPLVVD